MFHLAELEVTALIKDETFRHGAGVKKWHSLVVGSTTHLVGLGSANVTLLTATLIAPDVGSGHTYSISEQKFCKCFADKSSCSIQQIQ